MQDAGIWEIARNWRKQALNRETVKYSFISSLPVMAGYVVLGIGFGVLLADKGYSSLWAILISVLIYAGSLQYVGVGLLSGGASLSYMRFLR